MDKVVEDQDFDALSEESFDFGHFHELDSDLDEPEVEDEVLDPFTAAQREELLEDDPEAVDLDWSARPYDDDKEAFTQKLISNAKTLKQLQESGGPTVEVEYELDSPPKVSPNKFSQASSGRAFPVSPEKRRVASQVSVSTDYSQQRGKVEQPLRSSQATQRDSTYRAYTQRRYNTLHGLDDEDLVHGKYHSFPSRLLKPFDFETCLLILDNTKLYSLNPDVSSDQTCIESLYNAENIMACPVFKILAQKDSRVLLEDFHKDDTAPCKVLALLPQPDAAINDSTHIRLSRFHFDHVPTVQAPHKKKSVTIVEEEDESFHPSTQSSQQDLFEDEPNPFPAAQGPASQKVLPSPMKRERVPTGRPRGSVLVITQYEVVDIIALREEWTREEELRQMYESEAQPLEVATQVTLGTDYSDPFVEHLDMQDFPVQESG
ncbi:protein of unknown function [Taphrina deformans PYCC 5710]|uniref:Uncharacterized protein n=1 Tax=Taphrina deformans (strain PYCC 5710 / ATCC 11124 / CBS 356.35 / IMI 108563 / JCM 9778 / NBRC 8474) TaxID=1097556 RepID=R4XCC4_TAPDE|nr:protein of unknown function [Taphrina deformans PYCC 5710]|eukprot:CCG83471.1 protein of unknown function [Taphrina deformans PYCC 5710]